MQNEVDFDQKYIASKAIEEFDNMVETLLSHQINVHTFEDSAEETLPDAVFINNWITVMPNKELFLFPMAAKSRRGERRHDIVEALKDKVVINDVTDLSHHEGEGQFLESTGSMVFDYPSMSAYATISNRTSEKVFNDFCEKCDYEGFAFKSADIKGRPVYHTNILLSIATRYVILCADSIENSLERALLIKRFEKMGKEVIDISLAQMQNFAGNCMEVYNSNSESKLVMSRTGFSSLKPSQIQAIEKYSDIVIVNVSIIERVGGGSARCMMMGVPY